jgi:FMN phosphatase YigB (HAD superfamily)
MTARTLLLDLDDTLLRNPNDTFVPPYLAGMLRSLRQAGPSDHIQTQLLSATGKMIANNDPGRTLKQVFLAALAGGLQRPEADVESWIGDFYQDEYPGLEEHVTPMSGAANFISLAKSMGWTLVLATNPLYPLSAIQMRMRWGGLDPDAFKWISHVESSHFAKPNPAYYAELLGILGWPDGPVAMVGNDLAQDIGPAQAMGLHTFHFHPDHPGIAEPGPQQNSGGFEVMATWLSAIESSTAEAPAGRRRFIEAAYRSTPAVLDAITQDIGPEQWFRQIETDGWNLAELTNHLSQVDLQVNVPRLSQFSKASNPFVAAVDTDAWPNEIAAGLSGAQVLSAFASQRLKLLEMVEALSATAWQSPARHTIFGPTTLAELLSIGTEHDRLHVRQALAITQILRDQTVSFPVESG